MNPFGLFGPDQRDPGTPRRKARLSLEVLEDRWLMAANLIIAENQLPGSPKSEWDLVNGADSSIEGFTTDISADQGQTVHFKINTDSTDYRLDLYRMGYYDGLGARKVHTIQVQLASPQVQPNPITDFETGLVDAGNWQVSASWAVPATAVSGIYFAKLVRQDGIEGDNHIAFVVRDDDGESDLLFQTSDTTWQAYNNWGGKSFYDPTSGGKRAYKLSYNRPFTTRTIPGGLGETNWVFWGEYPMVRWLEANGYNVSYSTNVDTARRGAELLEHEVFLSVGHDEYWSAEMRNAAEAARAAGVNLAFFSGNEIYWKVRWEDSIDGSGTPFRTLVCYKESVVGVESLPPYEPPIQVASNDGIEDPSDIWTGLWRDTRFSPPGDAKVEQLLTGQIFSVNRGAAGTFGTSIQVPEPEGKLRFWRNTSVATLGPGEVAVLSAGTLGYEWDEDVDNGYRPAGLIRLSETTENVPEKLVDPLSWPGCGGIPGNPCSVCRGCMVAPGTATHRLTMYKDPSGAIVFGAGTVQWSWGLDRNHDGLPTVPDVRMQQATVNLFADMGVEAGTLQAGLVQTTASTDFVAPTSTVTSQIDGIVFQTGADITVKGTASDVGGLVGGIEISFDGGNRWHPAAGRSSWSFTWTPTGTGTFTVLTRAIDDSLNIGAIQTGPTFTVAADETFPPQISDVTSTLVNNQTVTITWTTDEASTSRVVYGTSPGNLNLALTDLAMVTAHSVTLTNLTPNTTYFFRVESTDEFNNTTTTPQTSSPALTFSTPAFVDTTAADFGTGQGSGVYASATGDGELILAPAVGVEFSGSTLPAGWTSNVWAAGGTATVGGGRLTLDGAATKTDAVFGPGRTLEFVATFSGAPFQHAGFSANQGNFWAVFSTGSDGAGLYVRTNPGAVSTDTLIPGNWVGSAHRFRIDWNSSSVSYWIDGTLVATHSVTVSAALPLTASDFNVGGGALAVDWMRLSPYGAAGSYVSRVFDAGEEVTWGNLSWLADTPAGTAIGVSVRIGNTPTPDAGWTDFFPIAGSALPVGGRARYLQYRLDLSTADVRFTPAVKNVTLAYTTAADTLPPAITVRSPAPGAAEVSPATPVIVTFNDLLNPGSVNSSTLRLRKVGSSTDVAATVSLSGSTVTLTPDAALVPDSQYQVTVSGSVEDSSGNALGGDVVWTFTTGWLTFQDTTATDFAAGSAAGIAVTQTGDGEAALAPAAGSEFGGAALPAGWTQTAWNTGGAAAVAGGLLTADGAMATAGALFGPGRFLEFVATFTGDPYQHVGLAQDFSTQLWAMFSTNLGGALYARTAGPGGSTDTLLTGNWLNAPHLFRIDWTASAVIYSIDGVQVASHAIAIGASLQPVASDFNTGGGSLAVDWMRLSPYAAAGTFTSRVFDAGGTVNWDRAEFNADVPAGTSLSLRVRMGDSAAPDGTWTDWVSLAAPGVIVGGTSRYFQYRADLTSASGGLTPSLLDAVFQYTGAIPDTTAPSVVGRSPAPGATDVAFGTPVSVTFGELMDAATITEATFRLREVGATADVAATVSYAGSVATLTPTSTLLPNREYVVTLSGSVKDRGGNALGSDVIWTFTTGWLTFQDTTTTDFAAGSASGAAVTQTGDGEVALAPAAGSEFPGAALPAGWTQTVWNAGGSAAVSGGVLTVDGAMAADGALFGPGRFVEFVATFTGDPHQHAGLAQDFSTQLWAMFSTNTGGALYARTAGSGGVADTLLAGDWLNAPHLFRIDWTASAVIYSIDGVQVASHAIAVGASLRPVASDFSTGGGAVQVDWMRLSPYTAAGAFTSRVFDAGSAVTWDSALWTAQTPSGTVAAISVRMGDTAAPDATWTDWVPLGASGATIGGVSRYIQYRADLSTSDTTLTPTLDELTLRYTPDPDLVAPRIVSRSPALGSTGIDLLAPVLVTFSELMDASTINGTTVRLRAVGAPSDVPATVSFSGSTATLTPAQALLSNTQYEVLLGSAIKDRGGNALGGVPAWTFTTGAGKWAQTSVADFAAGAHAGTAVTNMSGGELQLAAAVHDDFGGTALGPDWWRLSWEASGGGPESITVSGGILSLAGTLIRSNQTFSDTPVEGRLSFGAAPFQYFGMATDLNTPTGNYWAVFGTAGTSDRLIARVNASGTAQDVDLGPLPAGFHTYRINPVAAGFEFYVDGALQTTINITFPAGTALRIAFSVFNTSPMLVDWARLVSHPLEGTFTSAVFDATRVATWGAVNWTAATPSGTSIVVETRSGDTATPDAAWSEWEPVSNGATTASPAARYFQYRVRLVTIDPTFTPTLFDIVFDWI